MRFFNKIGNNFFTGITHLYKSSDGKTVQRQAQTESAGLISFKGVDSTQRTDLDKLNPYASMGVNFSKTPATTEQRIADVAQQEFGTFHETNFPNYLGLSNPQNASYDLADLNLKLNSGNLEGFISEHTNPEQIMANMQKSAGLSEFLG